MYLSNVYVHQGSFPTFCILVFDEIKFYRNESYFPSYFIYRSIEIFLKNDQRFVVGERYLKFEDSHNFFFSRLPSFLLLKIIIFLNFKFSKGEGSKEKYSIGENVLQPLLSLLPHRSQRSRHQRVVDVVSYSSPSREEGEGDSGERRSGCPRGF